MLLYDCVFAYIEIPWFCGIVALLTKVEAINNQYHYLVQEFGWSGIVQVQGEGGQIHSS